MFFGGVCVFIVAEIKQFWPGEKINDAHCCLPLLCAKAESANNRSHFLLCCWLE